MTIFYLSELVEATAAAGYVFVLLRATFGTCYLAEPTGFSGDFLLFERTIAVEDD